MVPLKAVLMNVLSLGASYGLLVWVFQDGHFAGLLGFEPLDGIDPTIPLVMFAVVFGLSMDYEVFLLLAHPGGVAAHAATTARA